MSFMKVNVSEKCDVEYDVLYLDLQMDDGPHKIMAC